MSEHSHDHHEHHNDLENASLLVLLLNLFFTIFELVGGVLTNSISIISDAIHDFGDVLSLLLSYILIKKSKKPRTIEYTFGFKSLITLGALINTLVLLISSGFILIKATQRISNPEVVNSKIMFFLAIIGIIINSISVFKFISHKNVISKSLMFHLLEDVLGWIAILISSVIIYFFEFYIIDSLLAIGISIFLFINMFKNLKQILQIILYKTPSEYEVVKIQKKLENTKGVVSIHDIRFWTLDGQEHYFIAHVQVEDSLSLKDATNLIATLKNKLKDLNINNSNLELEINSDVNHKQLEF